MFSLQVLMSFMLLGLAISTANIYIDTSLPEDVSPVLRRGKFILLVLRFFLCSLSLKF
jgi:uncharacterized membrane protein